MHRALTVAVVLAVVAGSVPAAASLADGTPSTSQPGASFAGVIGVQGAEVDNEVANRSLDRQFRAAESNRSKARVVASQSQQLEERLAELEAEKERLNAAYENGSISKGKYTAQLAVVAAELRALERRANQTADVAERLPPEALREAGANASHVREIAQHANRTGGGEVAEAAREIGGKGVGDGLGGPPTDAGPPNGSEAGPPDNVGQPDTVGQPENAGNASGGNGPPTAGNASGNASDRAGDDVAGPPSRAGNRSSVGNGSSDVRNGSGGQPTDAGNATDAANRSSTGNAGDTPGNAANATNRTTAHGNASENGNAGAGSTAGNESLNASNTSQYGSGSSIVLTWQDTSDRRDVHSNRSAENDTTTDETVGRATFSLF